MKTNMDSFRKTLFSLIAIGFLSFTGAKAFGQVGHCTVIQQPCNGDGILVTTITSGMTPPLTFTYYPYNNTVYSSSGYSDIYTGEYTPVVYITDGYGNQLYLGTSPFALPFNVDMPVVTTPAVCPNPGTAAITINSGISPDYVEWYDHSLPFPGVYVGTGNPMNLSPGRYIAKVFYNGCYIYNDSNIYIANQSPVNFSVVPTPANCTNGTATVTGISGGTGPYSYLWWNGATSASIGGLSQGSYSVRVTDNTGCYNDQYFYINQAITISVNFVITHPPTCLWHDGTVMAFGSGGSNPYTYLWSDGQNTQQAINLNGGTYLSVIVTDDNGCIGSNSVLLNATTPIVVTYTATASSCTASTGSATLTITGGNAPYAVLWNTFPQQTGTTASNLPPGNYGFTVTDINGCVQTGVVIIPPFSVINASIYSTNAICPLNTGSAGVSCSGTGSPFTYLWNTTATTPTISNLAPGSYSCHITDANGCSVTKYTTVYSTSPISVGIVSTPAHCIYATDGSLLAIPSGGTSYTFHWSNGSTSNPATNLAPGYYWVTVTSSGCSKTVYGVVGNDATSNACYCLIDGYVYNDPLTTCSGSGLTGIEHILVHLYPFGYTWTDATGYYSFLVPTGTYTLSEVVQYFYPLNGCTSNNPVPITVTAFSGCHQANDFFNLINLIDDVHLIPWNLSMAIPGHTFDQKLVIQNDGTRQELTALLEYCPDLSLGTYNSSLPLSNPSGSCFDNNLGTPINSGAETDYFITFNSFIPTNMPLNTVLNFTGIVAYKPPISNWLNDYTPWNNYRYWQATVVGSYDPNYKEVFPKGVGAEGTISVNDSVLDYVIHFQNTGTYYAENVVLIDSLDPNLDLTTLRPGYGSHAYTAELSETHVLKFTFKNINLVWKAENEINSNGMVTFSIKQKRNLGIGTKIQNTAAIYFDYNAPVMTNTTLNTIGYPVGTKEITSHYGIKVYPNPAETELYVNTGDFGSLSSLSIYDLAGRLMQTGKITMNPIQKVPLNDLPTGMYFINLVNVHGEKATSKFVKE